MDLPSWLFCELAARSSPVLHHHGQFFPEHLMYRARGGGVTRDTKKWKIQLLVPGSKFSLENQKCE